ncbi:ribonucleoside-diphosphate reductase, beta subunit [Gemella bergeri ATCC 700627]|uniref:ribonucleoside-diphosphate reductase n=1 Tax=Gemella bergeri ATCC 700627 TaxID=1321820 RepID=U2S3H2_9BACL|nr:MULTISPECIES: class 1b ribonucleoside-diphosphate reductase subunit beta [Gemella]AME09028.1 ribonucleotide-diphosphate reductase subunit beta [Gemella sp. oral taxon 928]AXI26598.1 class 1b ribonucleoside-diphosphate reductase subunit beta [Gemella sp. ND 6198]ERK60268.1 ribonucleoside-diphosphate reductase, beta subunit [Gemella bergeri ATCC 700627]
MKAVNWNKQDDLTFMYWRQNIAQFWVDTEFKVSKDIKSWNEDLNDKERDTYKKVLAGLTGLDTQQGDIGMPLVSLHTEDMRKQAVYSFMGMMEQIHAKSYSTIFTSLISSQETDYLLDEWVPSNKELQFKARIIEKYYLKLFKQEVENYDLYMARVASVFLESYIFYSGFFYPLYLAGQGKVTTSGEIIRKILLDETIHGSFTGFDAQEVFKTLTPEEQERANKEMYKLLLDLYENELIYTQDIYGEIGLYEEVKDYVEYNANRALANLGYPGYFEDKDINPIIENAMNTSTKNHDFFSVKGDGYVVSMNVESIEDEDFIFD